MRTRTRTLALVPSLALAVTLSPVTPSDRRPLHRWERHACHEGRHSRGARHRAVGAREAVRTQGPRLYEPRSEAPRPEAGTPRPLRRPLRESLGPEDGAAREVEASESAPGHAALQSAHGRREHRVRLPQRQVGGTWVDALAGSPREHPQPPVPAARRRDETRQPRAYLGVAGVRPPLSRPIGMNTTDTMPMPFCTPSAITTRNESFSPGLFV